MPPIDYLTGARRDFDQAFDWYAERSTPAAVRFAAAVDAAVERISADPTQFARPDGVHRECPVKKFPFRLVYRLVDQRIMVVAIAHAKRQPGILAQSSLTRARAIGWTGAAVAVVHG